MKIILSIIWLLIGAGCIAMAAFFKYKMISGWGWFLFAGIIIIGSMSFKEDRITINNDEGENEC
jgi:uncharacterized membrane protein HdeD (DUF308 family)